MNTIAVLLVLAAADVAVAAVPLDPKIVGLMLAGALLVKGTMSLLDKTGQLERLAPWARPQVTLVLAGVATFLESLAVGMDLPTAAIAFLGAALGSHHFHNTTRGFQKNKAAPSREG